MTTLVPVSGFALREFAPVKDLFARAVAQQGTGGAALSVHHDGEHVVDLVGGDYQSDSLQLLFSVSKAITAIAAHHAAERGLINLDQPLAQYWPEMAKDSTASITLRLVLSHRSGLASLADQLSFEQLLDGADDAAVGIQEPYWVPSTRHGYHAFTFGTLTNGAFRRVLGRSVGQYVADEIAGPNGLDLWIGTPESEQSRIRPITYAPSRISPGRQEFVGASTIPPSSIGRLLAEFDVFNDPRIYSADWPSTSGVASASALSTLFSLVLAGDILAADTIADMTRTQASGPDAVLGIPIHFGSGMQLPFPQLPFLGENSFGHEGAGGSAAFADPDFRVAVGWTSSEYPPMMGASPGFLTLMGGLRYCLTTPH